MEMIMESRRMKSALSESQTLKEIFGCSHVGLALVDSSVDEHCAIVRRYRVSLLVGNLGWLVRGAFDQCGAQNMQQVQHCKQSA